MKRHPHWSRWVGIKGRCLVRTNPNYKYYGGRGIGIYELWLEQPMLFFHYLDEVLGPCPPGHTLDRIDNNGNYEPGNLRWASALEQAHNRDRRKA